MKPSLIVLAPAVIVASLSLPSLAEDHKDPRTAGTSEGITRDGATRSSTVAAFMPTRVSDIVGLEVRNYQDEKLGKVEDLVVDLTGGRVAGLIVGVGGVLGVGDKPVMLPWTAFHYDSENKVLHLDRTKAQLETAAAETGETDLSTADTADRSRNAPADPNVTDQGNNDQDLNTTAKIRQDVLRQSDLSVSAQNVKIITVNGRVTLRGTVDSDAERQLILQLAENTAPGKVDSHLEVKPVEANR